VNIPTFLTLLRILVIPIFIVAFYLPVGWSNLVTTGIFAFAAITDWFDGYLARRWNQTSNFGAFLDPVADKLIVATALVLLVETHPSPWIAVPAVVIIGREITISALREWMASVGDRTKVAVSTIGKIKTTVQMIALLMLLYEDDIFTIPIYGLGIVFLYMAAILTLWSMFIYLRAALPTLLKSHKS